MVQNLTPDLEESMSQDLARPWRRVPPNASAQQAPQQQQPAVHTAPVQAGT